MDDLGECKVDRDDLNELCNRDGEVDRGDLDDLNDLCNSGDGDLDLGEYGRRAYSTS